MPQDKECSWRKSTSISFTFPSCFSQGEGIYATHQIVCTIGPATSIEERLEQLMQAGMNVARLNFSHGTLADRTVVIERIRSISICLGCSIAILLDQQGPKIRVG